MGLNIQIHLPIQQELILLSNYKASMKKLYIILGILIPVFTSSCSDYFDQVPENRLTMEEVFSSEAGIKNYLAGVYTYIPDECNQRQVHETALYRTPGPWTAASDEAEYTSPGNKAQMWNNNTVTATENTLISYRWKSWYTGIHEATTFLQYAGTYKVANLDDQLITQWKAEARALRAIYYFYLVRAYGPVPIIKEPIPLDSQIEKFQLYRNTADECFDYIISELKAAQNEGLLEHVSKNKSDGLGRIDKTIAQAFIVEALTFRASWLFNGSNKYYAKLTNNNGVKLFPTLTDAEKIARWEDVAREAKAFIDEYTPLYYQLESVTTNGVHDPYLSYRTATRGAYSYLSSYTELIFYRIGVSSSTMQYDRTPNHRNASSGSKGGALLAATQEQVDAYFMSNGLPPISGYETNGKDPIINTASGYEEKGTIGSDYKDANTSQLYAPAGSSKMYYKREPRFYADITFDGQKWLNTTNGTIYTNFQYSGNAGKKEGLNDYTKSGYLVRKCAPEGNWNTEDRVGILMRLPAIYFDYIEALCELEILRGGNVSANSEIWVYLNLIRERAGIPLYKAGQITPPTDPEKVKELIIAEKRVEMSFENTRFFDVRRWGIAKETQGKAIYGMDIEKDGSDFYTRTKIEDRVFTDRQYFFPIPQGEIDIDKNLEQNPGY